MVANKMRNGTSQSKTAGGVRTSAMLPIRPPSRLTSAKRLNPAGGCGDVPPVTEQSRQHAGQQCDGAGGVGRDRRNAREDQRGKGEDGPAAGDGVHQPSNETCSEKNGELREMHPVFCFSGIRPQCEQMNGKAVIATSGQRSYIRILILWTN